jgi:hypothetical protein
VRLLSYASLHRRERAIATALWLLAGAFAISGAGLVVLFLKIMEGKGIC